MHGKIACPKMEEKESYEHFIAKYTVKSSDLEEENRILKATVEQMKSELERYRRPPLMVCEVSEVLEKNAVIRVPNGNNFFVEVSRGCGGIRVGDTVLVEQKNLTVLKKIQGTKNYNVDKYVIVEKPDTKWRQIGGLEEQIREMREVIELPLKKPGLFKKVGIQPPKGVLLYGEPGTGKTLLAKAVAASTKSTFIEIVASELVQKFIGEGAKLVKEIFELARERAPSIIFIDEIDALAAKRVDLGTSGEREVQRTFMQLLAEIDGFKHLGMVKVIGCTNRHDILDPAIIRPGRLDRLIHVPLPGIDGRKAIFDIHTKKMSMESVDRSLIAQEMDGFSGADIKAVCTEAGYCAIRKGKNTIETEDLMHSIEKIRRRDVLEGREFLEMFG